MLVPMLHSTKKSGTKSLRKMCGCSCGLAFLAPPSITQEGSRLASKKTRDPSASPRYQVQMMWLASLSVVHSPRLANEIQAQNFKHPWLAVPLVKQKCVVWYLQQIDTLKEAWRWNIAWYRIWNELEMQHRNIDDVYRQHVYLYSLPLRSTAPTSVHSSADQSLANMQIYLYIFIRHLLILTSGLSWGTDRLTETVDNLPANFSDLSPKGWQPSRCLSCSGWNFSRRMLHSPYMLTCAV